MFLSGKSVKAKKYSLVIDIGSGSVAAGVIDGAHVIFSMRQRFDSADQTMLFSALNGLLGSVSKKAHELSLKVGDAHCFYSSPWQVVRTKSISMKKDAPFEITQKVFDGIFAHAAEEDHAFKGLFLVSQNILGVKINGYETTVPFGHKVKVLEATISLCFAPKDIITKSEEAVYRSIGHIKIHHHSFDLSAFLALRHAGMIPRDLVLLHIHHLVTDLIVSTGTMPREIVSFPIGTAAIASKASDFLHIDNAVALSKIRMYAEGKLQAEDEGMIKAALMQPSKEWLAPIEAFFKTLASENVFIPKKIFILADGDLWRICRDALAQGDFSKYAFSGEAFDIERIAAEENGAKIYLEALYCANI